MRNLIPYIGLMLLSVLLYRQCTLPPVVPETIIKERIIKVPEIVNHFDTVTIFKPFKRTIIDSTYKDAYLAEKDSVKRLNLYLKAITVKEYTQNFTDTFQSIDVYTKTRGDLLAQTVNYKTFEREIIYKDTVILPKPRRTLHLGVEGNNNLDFKAGLLYTNRKKTIYSVGVDIDKNISVGIFIPLIK